MLNLKSAEYIIYLISFVLCYTIIVTFTGFLWAWVAYKLGDSTPEEEGFLTLNPFAHVDILGLCFLLCCSIGWRQQAPVNPFNIDGKWKELKWITLYFADVIAYFLLAMFGMLLLLLFFDVHIIKLMHDMVRFDAISHLYIADAYPVTSSSIVSIGFLLIMLIYLSILFGIFNFIINVGNLAILLFYNRNAAHRVHELYQMYNGYIMLCAPLFILFFLTPMHALALKILSYWSIVIASIVGIKI